MAADEVETRARTRYDAQGDDELTWEMMADFARSERARVLNEAADELEEGIMPSGSGFTFASFSQDGSNRAIKDCVDELRRKAAEEERRGK